MTRRRKYSLNDHAFSVLTPDALYWLGWMATDGYVRVDAKGAVSVALKLKAEDLGLLENFRDFLGSDAPLTVRNGMSRQTPTQYAELTVFSRQMFEDLGRYGITPRKTDSLRVSDELAASPDFWRGALEGDGTMYMKPQRKSAQPSISLYGNSEPFHEQFRSFVRERVPGATFNARPVVPSTPGTRGTSGRTTLTCSSAAALLRLVYANAAPQTRLERKWAAVQEIMAWEAYAGVGPSEETLQQVVELYGAGHTAQAVGKEVGYSGKHVGRLLAQQGVEIRPQGLEWALPGASPLRSYAVGVLHQAGSFTNERFEITSKRIPRERLEAIAEILGAQGEVREVQASPGSLRVMTRNTDAARALRALPPEYGSRDYLLGMLHGRGTVSMEGKTPLLRIGVPDGELEALKGALAAWKPATVSQGRYVQLTGKKAQAFLTWLLGL